MGQLKAFFSPEILPTELSCLTNCFSHLKDQLQVHGEVFSGSELTKEIRRFEADDFLWFWSKDWKNTISEISRLSLNQKTLVSVLSTTEQKSSLWGVLFEGLKIPVPANVTLAAHSPLSYRFLVELVGLPEVQVANLPFLLPAPSQKKTDECFSFGCLCPLLEESNLHFILTVAHSLKEKKKDFCLNLIESGNLKSHLENLAGDLDIKNQVKFTSFDQRKYLDVFLYFPERNDHFIPVLFAAGDSITPISKPLPGLDQFIEDNQTGFLFEQEDARAVADLLLSLSKNPELCSKMGARFQRKLAAQLEPQEVIKNYATLLMR